VVFSTIIFLCAFLPISILGYYLLPAQGKNMWLLLCSIFFYAWGEPSYLWIMLLSIVCNYVFGLCIAKTKAGTTDKDVSAGRFVFLPKLFLGLAVFLNLGLLFVFKYFTFVMETVRKLIGGGFEVIEIALPIGISFYTFQGLSYVVDVYRREGTFDADGKRISVVQKNPFHLALYIAMFPQLIAGPIVRYDHVCHSLTKRSHSPQKFAEGAERFIIGLAKKAILANTVGNLANTIMQGEVGYMSASVAWMGAIAYTLQIYFDFSGYSDMAIGLGKIFGFEFMENFNYPYISTSIREFWRRWHISLSGWFRDYLYIPLGGNRKGNVYVNLFVVFLATGIWHGAAWGFLFWGIYHGIFILAERFLWTRYTPKSGNVIWKVMGWLYTMFVVVIGWVVFALVDLTDALKYISVMLGITHNSYIAYDLAYYIDRQTTFYVLTAILACLPWQEILRRLTGLLHVKAEASKVTGGEATAVTLLRRTVLLGLLALSFVFIINSSYNPFIYFRF